MLRKFNIIDEICGQSDFEVDEESIYKQIILITINFDVLAFNEQVLKKLKRDPIDYFSVDTASDDNSINLDMAMPIVFIKYLTPNGLPSNKLTLKEGATKVYVKWKKIYHYNIRAKIIN